MNKVVIALLLVACLVIAEAKFKRAPTHKLKRVGAEEDDIDLCPYEDESYVTRCTGAGSHYCILTQWICDGEDDCVDGTDELGC